MRTLLSALFLCVLSQVVGAQTGTVGNLSGSTGQLPSADYMIDPTMTCPDNYKLEPAFSFDVRDRNWKCIKLSDAPKAKKPHAAPIVSRHIELPSIDPLPCQSKAVGLGIGFRPCEKTMPIIDFSSSGFPPDEHVCTGHWEGGSCHDGDGWTGAASGDFGPSVMQSGGTTQWNGTADGTYDAFNIPAAEGAQPHVIVGSDGRWACKRKRGVKEPFECYPTIAAVAAFAQPTGVEGDNGTMEAYERDVPAIEERQEDTDSPVYFLSDGGRTYFSHYRLKTVTTCEDKTRYLMTSEDGTKHCIKF